MALSKEEKAAKKQAKQKKILIALSIVLVLVMAIQLPKLMGGKKGSTEAAPATSTTGSSTPATAPAVTTAPAVAAPAGSTALVDASSQKAGKAQLASFSLFAPKDPFVQQMKLDQSPTASAAGGGTGSAPAAGGGAKGGAGGAAAGGEKQAPAVPTYATISVNGEDQALHVKDDFPTDEPLFVLAAVSTKSVKIGIAGGQLANGKTVTLKKGQKLTLVDTATGARYTLQLLYTGTAPEQTATFTSGGGDTGTAGQTQQPAATSTTQTTTP